MIYHDLRYTDLETSLVKLPQVWQGRIWLDGMDCYAAPPADHLRTLGASLPEQVYLNIEHLHTGGSPWFGGDLEGPEAERSRDVIASVIDGLRAGNPDLKLGVYGIHPDFGWYINSRSTEFVRANQQRLKYDRLDNGRYSGRGAADRLNWIMPSWYWGYGSLAEQCRRIITSARIMREVHPDKRLCGFVSFHPHGDADRGLLTPEQWATILHVSLAVSDDLVIFAGWSNKTGRMPLSDDVRRLLAMAEELK